MHADLLSFERFSNAIIESDNCDVIVVFYYISSFCLNAFGNVVEVEVFQMILNDRHVLDLWYRLRDHLDLGCEHRLHDQRLDGHRLDFLYRPNLLISFNG